MNYHISHSKNFLESSESLEISTRRSSISKIYNSINPKKKYNFSKLFTKKNEISLADINKEIRREGGGS